MSTILPPRKQSNYFWKSGRKLPSGDGFAATSERNPGLGGVSFARQAAASSACAGSAEGGKRGAELEPGAAEDTACPLCGMIGQPPAGGSAKTPAPRPPAACPPTERHQRESNPLEPGSLRAAAYWPLRGRDSPSLAFLGRNANGHSFSAQAYTANLGRLRRVLR